MFKIAQDTCNKDGICAVSCPSGIIDFQRGEFPTPADGAEKVCIRCGHCVAVCPTGSFSHGDIPVEQCRPINKDLELSAEQAEQFLKSRRSIRVYRNRPVPRDKIANLIDIARYAPSGHNNQCAKWLVLDDKNTLGKLSGMVIDWMRWMTGNMPETATSFHMDRAITRWEEGYDIVLRDAPGLIIAYAEKSNVLAPTTCTIALTYLELAAARVGLGGCWAGYFNSAATSFPPMKEALSLPKDHACFGAMMVGYPKYSTHRLPLRNAPHITWRLSNGDR
jgi:nitroreductase/NAD-dependent dihydropyrimidine dehydrogenase PreA subunit